MFRAIIHKRIYLDSAKAASVLLKREIDLPFAPYVGLSLSDGLWAADPLIRVCWLVPDSLFSCELCRLFQGRFLTLPATSLWNFISPKVGKGMPKLPTLHHMEPNLPLNPDAPRRRCAPSVVAPVSLFR
jgi:hypothetical protein